MRLEPQGLVVRAARGREQVVQLTGRERGVIGVRGAGAEQQHAARDSDRPNRPAKPRVHSRIPIWSAMRFAGTNEIAGLRKLVIFARIGP
ncbi:hypothetical protein ACPPVO_02740 [Dactylosporangium sp. McL0621]|uniref:hypothetical protein n=1 Tax=Dactylosporangium sp. McL0621 TaxID=3415678 RepID=UPI003CFBABA3